VPSDEVVSAIEITKTEIGIKFGFRMRNTTARALWKVVSDFKRYPRLVEGLREVTVRGKGKTRRLRLKGQLVQPYDVGAKVTLSFSEKKGGSLSWVAPNEAKPNTGRFRVDADGKDAIFTLATRVRRGVSLPDFLLLVGLKTAMQAVGEGVRKAVMREKEID
jgi:hypothetical protein